MSAFAYPNGTKTAPRITGNFGPRQSFWTPGGWTSNYHYGTDMVGFSTVCSPVDGVVIAAAYSGGFGNLVKVREANGDEWWHAHLATGSFRVRAGDRVHVGQPLATMGTTGRSTGVHLHWEYHPKGGSARDAMPEARARIVALAGGGSKPLPTPIKRKRNRKMSIGVIHTDDKADKNRSGAIVDIEAGVFSPFGWFPVAYANGVAKGFGLEASAPVTRGHYEQIKRDVAAKAARDGKVFVNIDDADVPKILGA